MRCINAVTCFDARDDRTVSKKPDSKFVPRPKTNVDSSSSSLSVARRAQESPPSTVFFPIERSNSCSAAWENRSCTTENIRSVYGKTFADRPHRCRARDLSIVRAIRCCVACSRFTVSRGGNGRETFGFRQKKAHKREKKERLHPMAAIPTRLLLLCAVVAVGCYFVQGASSLFIP